MKRLEDSDVGFSTDATPAELLQELKAREDQYGAIVPRAAPGYEPLFLTLLEAHDQAAFGKGRARHAKGQPFMDQPIMEIARMVGPGYQTGQAMKKAQEATSMVERGEHTAAMAELLGAMNYLAAAYLLIMEKQDQAIGEQAPPRMKPPPDGAKFDMRPGAVNYVNNLDTLNNDPRN